MKQLQWLDSAHPDLASLEILTIWTKPSED